MIDRIFPARLNFLNFRAPPLAPPRPICCDAAVIAGGFS
jgi:hypothetical protein